MNIPPLSALSHKLSHALSIVKRTVYELSKTYLNNILNPVYQYLKYGILKSVEKIKQKK